jgi:hypothetical protein
MDEPEAHLHPPLLAAFIRFKISLIKTNELVAVGFNPLQQKFRKYLEAVCGN